MDNINYIYQIPLYVEDLTSNEIIQGLKKSLFSSTAWVSKQKPNVAELHSFISTFTDGKQESEQTHAWVLFDRQLLDQEIDQLLNLVDQIQKEFEELKINEKYLINSQNEE